VPLRPEPAIAEPGGDVFKRFFDLMESVRARLDQERDAAALRAGQSPEAARERWSTLFGRDTLMDRGENPGDVRFEESSEDTDTSRPD
jgi:hypothetical protein